MAKTDDQTTGNDVDNTPSSPPDVGQPSSIDRELVYADDGKLWREKFNGLKGRTQQLEKEKKSTVEEYKNTLDELESTVESKDSKITQLAGKLENAGEQLSQLKDLQDRVPKLESKARQADKLRAVLEYPELVNRQVKDMIETEDGEHEIVTNPILDLVESTNLEGDELRTHLSRLNRIVAAGDEIPEPEPTDTSVTEGAAPAPGEHVEEGPEYWEQKAREAHKLAIGDPDNREKHMNDMQEYTRKMEEAQQLQS